MTKREAEKFLRQQAGCSRKVACHLAARLPLSTLTGMVSGGPRDAGPGVAPPHESTGSVDDAQRDADVAAELCRVLTSYFNTEGKTPCLPK